jgi:hypothetical protein
MSHIDLTSDEYQESDHKHGVMTKKSTIPKAGNGLFADRAFKINQVIIPYKGERLTKAQKEARYPKNNAKYLLQLSDNVFIDAASIHHSNLARYANHKPFSQANAKITNRGNITAKKPIKKGSEIFITYGNQFHF